MAPFAAGAADESAAPSAALDGAGPVEGVAASRQPRIPVRDNASGRTSSSGVAAAGRTAPQRLSLLSLHLPRADEEEAYWRDYGTAALASIDAWSLVFTLFNV